MIKRFLGYWFLKRKYLKKKKLQIKFNKFFKASSKFLLILPNDEQDVKSSFELVNYINLNNKTITVILDVKYLSYFKSRFNNEVITYSLQDINYFGLPTKDFLNKLNYLDLDVVLDLNENDNYFSTSIANYVKTKIKISIFENKKDEFYNLILLSNSRENTYINLIESLKMF